MQPSRSWQDDKREADVFMPAVKRIMGGIILADATMFEDQHQNTDLRVLVVRGTRIAVRVRRHVGLRGQPYLKLYGHQFTLRLGRDRGGKTELEKISEGWGDWFFYGFGDYDSGKLLSYVVVDLSSFRKRLIVNNPPVDFTDEKNPDGSSSFRSYALASFDSSIIVRRGAREAA